MNRLAYLCGAGLIFAIGFYTGQKHAESGLAPQAALAEKAAATTVNPAGGHGLRNHGRHNLLSPPPVAAVFESSSDAQSGALPPPPHESGQGIFPAQPSPDDIVRQESLSAEMIASMRASHLPKEEIAQVEKALAAQKEALADKASEPPMLERSAAELAAELRESLKQAGAPPEIINDMVERMHPSTPGPDATETEPGPPQNLPPAPPPPG